MAKYLVPKPIKQEFELLAGWDLAQAGIVATGVAGGVTLFALTQVVGLPVPLGLLVLLVPGAAGVGLAAPQPGGSPPLYRRLQDARAYRTRQRRYVYDWSARD